MADDVPGRRGGARRADRTPTLTGWAAVGAGQRQYGIGDVNLVKPGVGETTRVLLRRVPWQVLVRPERGTPTTRARLAAGRAARGRGRGARHPGTCPTTASGLIHPRFTRGATGADGRAAATSALEVG